MSTPDNPASRMVPHTTEVDYRILRTVTTYEEAQHIVDRLSDNGFPVEKARIVGTGLRSVEQITGRMTTARAAGRGALGGVWFGLMIGILLWILAPLSGLLILLLALGFGAVWGAIFGAIGHAMTRGKRDFASVRVMEADSYDVLVEAKHVAQAAQVVGA